MSVEFTMVPRRGKRMTDISSTFTARKTAVASSLFYKEVVESLPQPPPTSIRCLALGSPTQDLPALYQLAFLAELASELQITSVSFWDPAFTATDIDFITGLGFVVAEEAPTHPFYFLPHAPLSLTELVLRIHQPTVFMANDLLIHGGRKTRAEVYESYPHIALAGHSIGGVADDGFATVTKRKGRARNKAMEPPVVYDYGKVYFTQCEMVRYQIPEGGWGNAFSDLALHTFTKPVAKTLTNFEADEGSTTPKAASKALAESPFPLAEPPAPVQLPLTAVSPASSSLAEPLALPNEISVRNQRDNLLPDSEGPSPGHC